MKDYRKIMAGVEEPTAPVTRWWKHDPAIVGGIVERIGDQASEFGTQKVVVLQTEEGLLGRRVNGSLDSELSAASVKVGDEIAIKWLGLKRSEKSGRDYHTYAVRVVERGGSKPTEAAANGTASDEEFEDDIPF